jgi:hypothetical protein
MNVDLDKLVDILKSDKPLSGWMVEEHGKDKCFCLVVLPELAPKVIEFANQLLKDNEH